MAKSEGQRKWEKSGDADRWAQFCRDCRRVGKPNEISRAEWARETGIPGPRWSNYESGGAVKSLADLFEVAESTNTDIVKLIGIIKGKAIAGQGSLAASSGAEIAAYITRVTIQEMLEASDSETLVAWAEMINQELLSRIPRN